MDSICILKPKVTREEALAALDCRGMTHLLWRVTLGRLRRIAQVFVPFRVYQVNVENAGRVSTHFFGLDAVSGDLDLYDFWRPPLPDEVVLVATRNHPEPCLDHEKARAVVLEKVRRSLFLAGAFRLRHVEISVHGVVSELHVPYWVGFYGSDKLVRLRIIDALRHRPEGAKLRHLLSAWLAA